METRKEILEALDKATTKELKLYYEKRIRQNRLDLENSENLELLSLQSFLSGKKYIKERSHDNHISYYHLDEGPSDLKGIWAGMGRLKKITVITPDPIDEDNEGGFECTSVHYDVPKGKSPEKRCYFSPSIINKLSVITEREFKTVDNKYKQVRKLLREEIKKVHGNTKNNKG